MAVKPDKFPEWARTTVYNGPLGGAGNPNFLEPPEGVKDIGWQYNEFPPREYSNWQQRLNFQWLQFFDETTNATDSFFTSQW